MFLGLNKSLYGPETAFDVELEGELRRNSCLEELVGELTVVANMLNDDLSHSTALKIFVLGNIQGSTALKLVSH